MSMWILVILVALAMSLGSKVMLDLQLAKNQRDSLRAYCLANAAIYRTVEALKGDVNTYDALGEPWADDKKSFEKITLNSVENQFANVSYRDQNGGIVFGVRDEDRKININRASLEELEQLFIACGESADALALAQMVIEWRSPQASPAEEKAFKFGPLSVVEELQPALEYYFKDKARAHRLYLLLADSVSVCSNDKVNINTVSDEVLRIISYALAKHLALGDSAAAEKIVQDILALRKTKGYFTATDEIVIQTAPGPEQSLFEALRDSKLSVRSHAFLVQATGIAGSVNKTITAIYDRDQKKYVLWKQN